MTDPFDSEQANGGNLVVRLSRTATGTRTYTVGASVPLDADAAEVMIKVFALADAAELLLREDGAPKGRRDNLEKTLRLSLLIERMRALMDKAAEKPAGSEGWRGWVTTTELVPEPSKRTRVVADLQTLVREGRVEYRKGGNGRGKPSYYRLAPEKGVTA